MTDSERLLLQAIRAGDLASVRRLLKQGVSPAITTAEGTTPLMAAAESGGGECVSLLLGLGAEVDAIDRLGMTALSFAAERGAPDIAELLLERGADLEAKGNRGVRPLVLAARGGHLAVVDLLVGRGAEIDAACGHPRGLGRLTDEEEPGEGRGTPLMWAARNGHIGVAKALLAKGAKMRPSAPVRSTPLMWAAECGHCEMIGFLLEAGADIHVRDHAGWTALFYAANFIQYPAVHLLLDRGSFPFAMSHQGQTACGLTQSRYASDIFPYNRQAALSIMEAIGNFQSAFSLPLREQALEAAIKAYGLGLREACAFDFDAAARLLVAKGADIDELISLGYGTRGLALAARLADVKLFLRLVEAGADPTVSSLLTSAASAGSVEIGRFLLGKDARWAATFLTETPLTAAASNGRVDFVRLLIEYGVPLDSEDARAARRWLAGQSGLSKAHIEIRQLLGGDDGGVPEDAGVDSGIPEIWPLLKGGGGVVRKGDEIGSGLPSKEVRYQVGPILIIEHRGPFYVNYTHIVVATEKDKELSKGLLTAAFPEQMAHGMQEVGDGMVSFSFSLKSLELQVVTLDEYIVEKEKIDASIPERKLAGVPAYDAKKERTEIAKLLESHFAVVFRDVEDHTVQG